MPAVGAFSKRSCPAASLTSSTLQSIASNDTMPWLSCTPPSTSCTWMVLSSYAPSIVSGSNTNGTHADGATAWARRICQPAAGTYVDHSSRGTLSAASCTAHGDSPIHVGVNCHAWPVFTVVAFSTSTGTLLDRRQL